MSDYILIKKNEIIINGIKSDVIEKSYKKINIKGNHYIKIEYIKNNKWKIVFSNLSEGILENDILTINDKKYYIKLINRDRKQILMEIRDESDNLCSKIVINKWEIAIENYNCDEISIALGVLSVAIYINIVKGYVKMPRNVKIMFIILTVVLTALISFLTYQSYNYNNLIILLFIYNSMIYTFYMLFLALRKKI
ncbi:MAG: hypothetical protein ACP5JT_04475 [Thermoplasmata archaeon]